MDEPAFLRDTRDSYSRMAADYAEMVRPHLAERPLERALLEVFAELVRTAGGGPVADIGCGPGQNTAYLRDRGLSVFGLDLAPGMVDLARQTYPDLRFEVGSMLDLALADGSLAGLLASYSIIHVPWASRPRVFSEFARVLAPGGHLMLMFQIGREQAHRSEAYGLEISVDWYRQEPEDLLDLLGQAGFEPLIQTARQPEPTEKAAQGCLIVRRPAAPA